MSSQKDFAIILAAYGSLYPQALATYDRIKATYEQEFPTAHIMLVFTSRRMRRKKQEKDGLFIHDPLAAVAELKELGYRDVIIQSLQVVPGKEFHQLISLVQGLRGIRGKFGFRVLEICNPLLSDIDDCRSASKVLRRIIGKTLANDQPHEHPRDSNEEAILLMGHGTGHPADSLYSVMGQVLQKDQENIFMGTLEGFPDIKELISPLKMSGAKKIRLYPFLIVAGGHVIKDLAGDGATSCRSILMSEGFEVETCLNGLGDSDEIVDIFINHTRRALRSLEKP